MSLATERRAARERALGLLYEAETKGCSGAELLAELPVVADEFAVDLVRAVDAHRTTIDELLERYAEGWSLARMPALDRAALRMGSAELLTRPDVPTGVVLAETVELASRFSTDASGRFVNGLLARIAREVRPDSGAVTTAEEVPAEEPAPDLTPLVDGVIIDLDGVIRHWDAEHLPAVEARFGLPPGSVGEVAFEADRLARAMDGRLAFQAWCDEIGASLAAAHGVEAAAVAEAWSAAGWTIDGDVLDLVEEIRRTVPVALLSNASSRLLEDLEWSGIAGAFDVVVGSWDAGLAKPASGAFEAAAEALDVRLERCLFVDDTIGHVEAARALGMRAEPFTDVDALRALGTDLGLLR